MAEIVLRKVCSACKLERPLNEFGQQAGYRDGFRNQCNPCRSRRTADYLRTPAGKASMKRTRANPEWRKRAAWAARLKKHGLTREEYDKMLASQGGCCMICGTDTPGRVKGQDTFHIDHCHQSGKVRGLLCFGCNTSLGKLGDTPESLLRAYLYVSGRLER